MAIIRIVQPPGVTPEMYDAVNSRKGVRESPPEGLILHTAGELDGKWQIVDVWESEEHARRFDEERLGPAVREISGISEPPAPAVVVYGAHSVIVP